MRHVLLTVLIAAFGMSAAACGETPSAKQCEKLFTHIVNVQAKEVGGSKLGEAMAKDLADQKKKLHDYIGKDFLNYCKKDLPMEDLKCAMAAKTMMQLSECDEP